MTEAISQPDQAGFSSELAEQLKFETLLADLSARFVNVSADQVDSQIEEAQARICECLGIDHSALWQGCTTEPGINILTHVHGIPTHLRSRPSRRRFLFSVGAAENHEAGDCKCSKYCRRAARGCHGQEDLADVWHQIGVGIPAMGWR